MGGRRRRRRRRRAPPATEGTTAAHEDPGHRHEPDDDPASVVAYTARALGSELRLFVWRGGPGADADRPGADADRGAPDADRGASDAAWDEVRAEFDAVDLALSRFRADSELSALNRLAGSGRVVRVSWRLREALAAMHRACRITDGRFDASVLTALERMGEHGAPLDEPPRAAHPAPGADADGLERPRLVTAPASPVDTGGIGKGLALRWAAARAIEVLSPGAGLLLDAGGDVVAAGEPPPGGWRVGIEDPAAADDADPLAVIGVEGGAVATSSVRVRRWTDPDGVPVHHLVDPRSGTSARTGLIAVTVAGADPAWSEVWTKALFLAGRRAIGDEARMRGIAAWWVDEDGRLGMTPEARVRSVWVAESRLG